VKGIIEYSGQTGLIHTSANRSQIFDAFCLPLFKKQDHSQLSNFLLQEVLIMTEFFYYLIGFFRYGITFVVKFI